MNNSAEDYIYVLVDSKGNEQNINKDKIMEELL